MSARRDHDGIGFDHSIIDDDTLNASGDNFKPVRLAAHELRAPALKPLGKRTRQAERIGTMTLFRKQDQMGEPRRQRRVEFPDHGTGEHVDLYSVVASDLAYQCIGLEGLGRFVRVGEPVLHDQVRDAGPRGQRSPLVERTVEQRMERIGDPVHLAQRCRLLESPEPGSNAERVARRDGQGAHRIHQPSGHLSPASRQAERHAGSRAEAPGVAERTVLPRRPRVDYGDRVPLHLQAARAAQANHARADYRDTLAHL